MAARPRPSRRVLANVADARRRPAKMRDVRPADAEGVPLSVAESVVSTPANKSRQAQQAIQESIKEWILEQGLHTGDPMPTETELIDHLGISRNSVREALKALQALGIVEIRHGFGTYVGDCSLDPFADALVFRGRKSLRGDRRDMREIVDLRQALEAGLIGQLVAVVTDDALGELSDRLRDLELVAGQGEAGAAADRAFHEQLYAPIGNQLMSQLIRVFWDVYHDLSDELPPATEDPAGIISTHQAIYDAVAARDAVRASVAIVEHFKGIQERLRGMAAMAPTLRDIE